MPEILIRNATIFDGSGSEPMTGDVAVKDGAVAAVGESLDPAGVRVIDLRGLALAPGFIDFHTHADFTYPFFPDSAHSVSQGVTTEVVGNCGSSPAPLADDPEKRAAFQELKRELGPELDWSWGTFGQYLSALDRARPAVNCAPLVGHSAIRSAVIGMDDRPPTEMELTAMVQLVAEAMEAGAFGLSSGLVYPPSSHAGPDELEALVAVVAAAGGIYSTHMRDEGAGLAGAVEEAIAVARATGGRIQLSHLKSSGLGNHGNIGGALDLIEAARADALQVGFDAYPYVASSTGLTQVMPAWALVGGVEAIVERLRSPDLRERIAAEMAADSDNYLNGAGGWSGVMISNVEHAELAHYRGRNVAEAAAREGRDPAEVVFDVIVGDRAASTMIAFTMSQDDVDAALDHPAGVIGSDLLVVTSPTAHVHPRAYGTFAKVVSRAARRSETALADIVRRSSALPARRLGLRDRGTIAVGKIADLVAFDPAAIVDNATFEAPTRLATGVHHVWVGGELAWEGGGPADLRLGRVLRRGSASRGG